MKILHARRIILSVLLLAFVVTGCAYFEKKQKEKQRELLPVRNVKVVPFPVRPLEFENTKVRQEKDQVAISGQIKNISYSPVADVRMRALIFFANNDKSKALDMTVAPPVLQPGEQGDFQATGTVDFPISHVELHVRWEEYYPPGL
jgi:hypothetical protein